MKYFILFILLLSMQIIEAQSNDNIYWGLSINANMLFENNNGMGHSELLPPPNLYLHFGDVFNKFLRIDLFAGYIGFSDNWNGLDLGIMAKTSVIDKLYISTGFNYNSIDGGGGEGNQAPTYYKMNFSYYALGVGYLLTKIVYIEFNYEIPLNRNKVYGTSYYIQMPRLLKLNSRLKLDFGWNFSI